MARDHRPGVVGHGLARRRTGEGLARGPQRRHEDMGPAVIGQHYGRTGKVHDSFSVTGLVVLPRG